MKPYIVTYTMPDQRDKRFTPPVITAKSYTDAYVKAMSQLPEGAEITGLYELIPSGAVSPQEG